MRVLKNLKSLFIEETPAAPASLPAEPSVPSPSGVVTGAGSGKGEQASAGPVLPDEQFLSVLLSALEENNVEGYDYLEFRDALRSLRQMAMDEPTRFRSAFAVAQTMKATRDFLLRSGRVYLHVLDQEKASFLKALREREERDIAGRQLRVTQLEEDVRLKEQQIQALQQAIQEARREQAQTRAEVSQLQDRMTQTQERFTSAQTFLQEEIQADLSKIEQYLT